MSEWFATLKDELGLAHLVIVEVELTDKPQLVEAVELLHSHTAVHPFIVTYEESPEVPPMLAVLGNSLLAVFVDSTGWESDSSCEVWVYRYRGGWYVPVFSQNRVSWDKAADIASVLDLRS